MVNDALVFGILFVFGLFYALLLELAERQYRIVTCETWLTVVIGVGVTLALIGLFSLASTLEYWKLWAAFACTGGPVSARSVVGGARVYLRNIMELARLLPSSESDIARAIDKNAIRAIRQIERAQRAQSKLADLVGYVYLRKD